MLYLISKREAGSKKADIIYKTFNFHEANYALEEFALDTIVKNQGDKYISGANLFYKSPEFYGKQIPQKPERKERGFFAVSYPGRTVVFEKKKDTILYTGEVVEVCTYELFKIKFEKEHVPRISEMNEMEHSDFQGIAIDAAFTAEIKRTEKEEIVSEVEKK